MLGLEPPALKAEYFGLDHALLSEEEEKEIGARRLLSLPYDIDPAPKKTVIEFSLKLKKLEALLCSAPKKAAAEIQTKINQYEEEIKTVLKDELKISDDRLNALAESCGLDRDSFQSRSEEYFFDPINFHNAINELVEHNMKLAYNTALSNYQTLDLFERIGICNDVLINAAYGFNPEQNRRFSTYAVTAMKWELGRAVEKNKNYAKSLAEKRREEQVGWHQPETLTVVLRKEEVKEIISLIDSLDCDELQQLYGLESRDVQIFKMRLIDGWSLKETASELGISRERVRQLQKVALLKIKTVLEGFNK